MYVKLYLEVVALLLTSLSLLFRYGAAIGLEVRIGEW